MRKSPASSTSPADRKSSRNPTPSFASSIAGTFPSSSNMRGSNSRASAPPCSATARQFFIMRQNDRADLEDMAQDIALPEVTKHAIMNYPLPDHQSGQKYSPFTYFHTDSGRNLCGTAHNISSREMLYCSSSSGEHFDKRARELRKSRQHRRGHHRPRQFIRLNQNQNAYEKIIHSIHSTCLCRVSVHGLRRRHPTRH